MKYSHKKHLKIYLCYHLDHHPVVLTHPVTAYISQQQRIVAYNEYK